MMTTLYKKGELTDHDIDEMPNSFLSRFHEHVTNIIYMTPTYQHYLHIYEKAPTGTEVFTARQRALINEIHPNFNDMDQDTCNIYNQTWIKSNIVQIIDNKLIIQLPHTYPP